MLYSRCKCWRSVSRTLGPTAYLKMSYKVHILKTYTNINLGSLEPSHILSLPGDQDIFSEFFSTAWIITINGKTPVNTTCKCVIHMLSDFICRINFIYHWHGMRLPYCVHVCVCVCAHACACVWCACMCICACVYVWLTPGITQQIRACHIRYSLYCSAWLRVFKKIPGWSSCL